MSWYKENKEKWNDIIEIVSLETNRNQIMIEKDLIQSMFLYELSKKDLPFVFKGGTSLSKAYRLIDRFSEDIDLSMSRGITDNEKREVKNTIIEISQKLSLFLKNPNEIMSRYNYNKYILEYESLVSKENLELIIETSFYQEVYPIVKMNINNYISDFCIERHIILPFEFEAHSFAFDVQSLDRTFIDKIFAICDYRIQDMMDRDSRHLYDIAKIIPEINFDEKFKSLIVKVRNDRIKSKNNPSANPMYNITEMLKEIIDSKFYETDYKNLTAKLLYENYSYEMAIENGIKRVVESNVF